MKKFTETLTRSFQENPVVTIGVGAAFITSLAKFISAIGNARGSHAYAKQVNHRVKGK